MTESHRVIVWFYFSLPKVRHSECQSAVQGLFTGYRQVIIN